MRQGTYDWKLAWDGVSSGLRPPALSASGAPSACSDGRKPSDLFDLIRLFVEKVPTSSASTGALRDHALAPCVDEMSQMQALYRTQPPPPLSPGQAERRSR